MGCISLQLLIGFECGQIVLWDLRSKLAEYRCQTAEPIRSISWHYEGKQFICSHIDGSLTTWSIKQNNKPILASLPHGKNFERTTTLVLCSIPSSSRNLLIIVQFVLDSCENYNSLFILAKVGKDGKYEQCKAIMKVEWKSSRSG